MSAIRHRTEKIRNFILKIVSDKEDSIITKVVEKFGISRQSANKHLRQLVDSGDLVSEGKGRAKKYLVAPGNKSHFQFQLDQHFEEDTVFHEQIRPLLEGLPDNIKEIWEYGLTEMFNNAKEHSGGSVLSVGVTRNAANTVITMTDNGVGIFKKIQDAFKLPDIRQSVLELSKGKLTTDPANHTGEGIFFTSRSVDAFFIFSDGVVYNHLFNDPKDWIMQADTETGTSIVMDLSNHSSRTIKKIFSEFCPADEYSFNKTVVPLQLASFETGTLVSRSQAKRVVKNLEKFDTIILNFDGVKSVGQGFADEVFRVWQNKFPDIKLIPVNTNPDIDDMIKHVLSTAKMNQE